MRHCCSTTLFDGFPGVRNYRALEQGAEWISRKGQSMIAIARDPLDQDRWLPADDEVFLRIWTQAFAHFGSNVPVEITLRKAGPFLGAQIRRGDPEPGGAS